MKKLGYTLLKTMTSLATAFW